MVKARVLIADDNIGSVQPLRESLTRGGYLCEAAANCASALSIVQHRGCQLAICDVRIGGTGDFELLDRMKEIQPALPVIVGTSSGSILEAVAAIKHGAFEYVEKPFNITELMTLIARATASCDEIHETRTAAPPQPKHESIRGDLVHASSSMRNLVESIALVARSSAAVLVLGESGTGKERVARAIHAGGPRARRPFVAVNMSAIPEQLLESEVFGHVRGAFSGATQARRGLLLEADGGTLLLDEIGDMPIALQPKLLRVLQFGEVRAVGSDRVGHVDVRIIAATHRDLDALVRQGRFREDLRYRLNVIPLVVPPLRERREDIRPLVTHFLREARARTEASPVNSVNDQAMEVLIQSFWPGNVRELEHAIERLVVLGRTAVITPQDLSFLEGSAAGDAWPGMQTSPWTLKQMNRRYLDWVLARTEGDKVRAAGILDIDLSTLYRWERARR